MARVAFAAVAALLFAASAASASSSSSSSSHCNPQNVLEDAVRLYNERRYDELAKLYAPDALRYVNGDLDTITRGRPWNKELHVCMAAQLHSSFVVHTLGRFENMAAAAALTLHVGGVERIDRQMGVGLSFEVGPSSCKIVSERVYFAATSDAYKATATGLCHCMPEATRKLGLCSGMTNGNGNEGVEVDLELRLAEFVRAVEAGDAGKTASFFAPQPAIVTNGVLGLDMDYSQASVWAELFKTLDYSDAALESVLRADSRVHAVGTMKVANRGTSDFVSGHFGLNALFNEAGEIVELEFTLDQAISDLNRHLAMLPPSVAHWTTEEARAAFLDTFERLGYPTVVTNVQNGGFVNFAYWGHDDVKDACWAEVWVMDMAVRHAPVRAPARPHDVFVHTVANLHVPDALLDDVRGVSPSIIYDTLKQQLHSRGANLDENVVDTWVAARVATGEIDAAEARDVYSRALAAQSVTEVATELSLDASLCSLIS